MVRLVFRPYSKLLRTICTSVSRRASIRVSSDFTLSRNRSPSFGSDTTYYDTSYLGRQRNWQLISLRMPKSIRYARKLYQLLGPCFKTGPHAQQKLHSHERSVVEPSASAMQSSVQNFSSEVSFFPHSTCSLSVYQCICAWKTITSCHIPLSRNATLFCTKMITHLR